jgi:hypothetical protein
MSTLHSSLRAAKILFPFLSLALAVGLALGQGQLGGAGKPGAKDAACDGALEIVPTKVMSFARKRRPAPAKPAEKQSAAAKESGGGVKPQQ